MAGGHARAHCTGPAAAAAVDGFRFEILHRWAHASTERRRAPRSVPSRDAVSSAAGGRRSRRSGARVGRIHTPHGVIQTPGFVAVATNAALKAVDAGAAESGAQAQARHGGQALPRAGTHRSSCTIPTWPVPAPPAAGQQALFCNTFHLLLHPGTAAVAAAGGLHAFMGWRQPIMTDSGGFQVHRAREPHAPAPPACRQRRAALDPAVPPAQVFSLAHGTVHEEVHSIKRAAGQRGRRAAGSLVQGVTEEGVRFRSYRRVACG